MVNSYVTASIQSAANAVGHIPGTNKPCARRGAIKCVVRLGGLDVDYLSYLYVFIYVFIFLFSTREENARWQSFVFHRSPKY